MKNKGFTSEKLNFVLAFCAILISAASFYATYLQAEAADKQVKAMTLPLLQYGSGNYDDETKEQIISFVIKNAGVGPALIKNLKYSYEGDEYQYFSQFLRACCAVEVAQYQKDAQKGMGLENGGESWSALLNTILPGNEDVEFYRLYPGKLTENLWSKLNDERHKLEVSICYCSLLEECFITEKKGVVVPIEYCSDQS